MCSHVLLVGFFERAALLQVWVGVSVRLVYHGACRHTGLLQRVHDFVVAALAGPLAYAGVQLVVSLVTPVLGVEPRVFRPRRRADCGAKGRPVAVIENGNVHPAVFAFAGVATLNGVRVAISDGSAVPAVHRVVHEELAHEGSHVFGLCQLDELALARAPAVVQSSQHGECALRAGGCVRHVHLRVRGGVHVGVPPKQRMSDRALHVNAERPKVFVGPGASVGRHSEHQDVAALRSKRLVRNAQLVHGLGDVVLDENVADLDQAVEDVSAARLQQVHGHAQLVAPVGVEDGEAVPGTAAGHPAGHTAEHRGCALDQLLRRVRHRTPSERRGVLGRFDADDLGAEVGEQGRTIRAGPHDCHVQYSNTREGQCWHRPHFLDRARFA